MRSKYQVASLHANIQHRLNTLQEEVETTLRELIAESGLTRDDYNAPVIKVNVFGYTHLAIIDTRLVFLDKDGYQYGLDSECTLTDLVDIIGQQGKELAKLDLVD